MIAKKQGQFQIIVLEAVSQAHSHSLPGPWGLDITSSVPLESSASTSGIAMAIKILPRPNERSVDPNTLKVSHS